jgi:hypothetical protein
LDPLAGYFLDANHVGPIGGYQGMKAFQAVSDATIFTREGHKCSSPVAALSDSGLYLSIEPRSTTGSMKYSSGFESSELPAPLRQGMPE